MKAYSLDLGQKILRACDQRLGSQRTIAALFGVSQSFVEKLLRRRRTSGDIAPHPHAGGRRPICDATALAHIRRLVHGHPDATLAELSEQLAAQHGLRVSVPTLGRLTLHLKLPRKKSRSTLMSATPSGSSKRARPIGKRSQRSTSRASSSATNRASTSR
jgi:transposase